MRVLNVAEKPSAAEEISTILAGRRPQRRDGLSKFNCIWEFKCNGVLGNDNVDMMFTSVLGHLMSTDMVDPYTNWNSCDPIDLFQVPIHKFVKGDTSKQLYDTIQREARKVDAIILWLDCDREGENIAFEVLECAQKSNPRVRYHRARFSSIIPTEINRAIRNLIAPNQLWSTAVDTRSEIDLRLGAVFTRYQTNYLRARFNLNDQDNQPISYGPCQFPTLGFVVQRQLRIDNFVPEEFWTIKVTHHKQQQQQSDGDGKSSKQQHQQIANFSWKRKRLFEHAPAFILFEKCYDNPIATVVDINSREYQNRPIPLTTIELQKLASKKLRISSDQTMKYAEELYNKGYISYPRTETDQFVEGTDFASIVNILTQDRTDMGDYARKLLNNGTPLQPRAGRNNDNSHPPIHPTGYNADLRGPSKNLYEFIARHFLACVSLDSVVAQSTVTIDIEGEQFTDTGSMIKVLGYLEVYKYETRTDRILPTYTLGEQFTPTKIELISGKTESPKPISEMELLTAMDNNKIGTDATMAQHIKKIVERNYVIKDEANHRFTPTELGKALIMGYDAMGFDFSKPDLRAQIEADVLKICTGTRNKEQVLKDTIEKYKGLFIMAQNKSKMLDVTFSKFFQSKASLARVLKANFSKCGKCNNNLDLLSNGEKKSLHCNTCFQSFSLPLKGSVSAFAHTCPLCNYQVVRVENEDTGSAYFFCPNCRSNHPTFFKETSPFHCFQCTAQCKLATGQNYKPSPNVKKPASSTFKKKPAANNYQNNQNNNNNGGRGTRTTRVNKW